MSRVERLLDKAQTMWEKEMSELNGLPDPAQVQNGWYSGHYQEFRKLLDSRNRLGFANGVFHALAAFSMDEKKERTRSFNHGDGI